MTATVGERMRRTRVTPFSLVVAAVLLPVVFVLVSVVGSHWYASADYVFEVLHIDDVGTRHTPLVGAYSRFGWDHPGPLLWWVLAPFHLLFGDTGIVFGTGLVNGAAIAGAVVVARRRGGLALAVVVAVVVLLLMQGLGTDLLIDPWNPWIPVLPFLVYVLLAWSIAERDFAMLPWLVGVGSFVVQSHLGYTPLVVGLAVVAALLARTHREDATSGELRRWVPAAAIVAAVCWIAPVVQQFTGSPGNLGEIIDYFRNPTEGSIGWAYGYGIMGVELGFPGAWVTGDDTNPAGLVNTASTGPALVVLAVAAMLAGLAWRRGERGAARFGVFSLTGAVLGVVAGARATGVTGPYVVRWWFVIAAMVYCSIAWSLWALTHRWWSARTPGVVRAAQIGIGASVAVFAAGTAVQAVPARVPVADISEVIGGLKPQLAAELAPDDTYLVTWIDARTLGAVGTGVFLALREAGFDASLRAYHSSTVGGFRSAEADEVDSVLLVVSGDSLAEGWQVPAGAVEVAHYDPLTPAERARINALSEEIRTQLDAPVAAGPLPVANEMARDELVARGADRDTVDDLWDLAQHAAHTVYLAAPTVAANIGA